MESKSENDKGTSINEAFSKNQEEHKFFAKIHLHTGIILVIILVMMCVFCVDIKKNKAAIEEIKEPVAVSYVNIDDELVMTITKMEQELDSVRLHVEELDCRLDSMTNGNCKQLGVH